MNIGVACSGCCCLFEVLLVAILVRMRLAHTPDCRKQGRAIDVQRERLEGEQQQEGHHQTEQTHGLGQGEAQNGVGEQLLFQRWVPGVADDEGTEYCSDTSTCCIGSLSVVRKIGEKEKIKALVKCSDRRIE